MTISEQVVKAMPERIYAAKKTEGSNCVVSFDTPSLDYNVEYIRADLAPFLPVQGAALEEACKLVERRINMVPPNTKAFRAYQDACRHILGDLRALASHPVADKPDEAGAQGEVTAAARELALDVEFATIRAMIYCYEGDSAQAFEAQKALAKIEDAIRALSSPDHADAGKVEGDGWKPIESAPHNEKVLLSWKDCLGEWTFEVFEASWGWRTDTVSNVSTHGKATHWRPLPSAPASEGAE